MYVTVYNTTNAPITVDAEGRQVGPHDWGTADTTYEGASDAIDANELVKVDVPDSGDVEPAAAAAAERTATVSDRAGSLGKIDKDVLAEVAAEAGIADAEELTKPELVAALANRPDVAVPASSRKPSKAQTEEQE